MHGGAPRRSGALLTIDDNLAFARSLADHAHSRGLAVAQKNAAELGPGGARQGGFDFAVAEECQVTGECDDYTSIYGDRVIEIEYTDTDPGAFPAACAARGDRLSIILRDRGVTPVGDPSYVYESC